MRVHNFSIKKDKDKLICSADFTFYRSELNRTVWFKIPFNIAPGNYQDAFFILALPLSFALGEDLEFNESVSDKLYKNSPRIKKLLNFSRQIKITVSGTKKRNKTGKGNGLFFSLGVDSFYSLLCLNQRFKPSNRITHLIHTEGLGSVPLTRKIHGAIRRNLEAVSEEMKVKQITVQTNLREVSDPIIHWSFYHGAATASVGALLSSVLSKTYLSTGEEYLYKMLWGSHYAIDKIWSTEAVSLITAGTTESKYDKILALSRSGKFDLVRRTLQVCFQKRTSYNCSRCEKCFRVHLSFLAVGAPKPMLIFEKPSPLYLKRMFVSSVMYKIWKRIYLDLKKRPSSDPEIISVLRWHLIKREYLGWTDWLPKIKRKIRRQLPGFRGYYEIIQRYSAS